MEDRIEKSVENDSEIYHEIIRPEFSNLVLGSSVRHIFEALRKYDFDIEDAERGIVQNYFEELGISEEQDHLPFLTTAFGFDRFSYSAFSFLNEQIDEEERKEVGSEVTRQIGQDIFNWMYDEYENIQVPDDFEEVPEFMNSICRGFVDCGYYRDAFVREDEDFSFDADQLRDEGITRILYQMDMPAILKGAQQLAERDVICQHYSSRTMEYALEQIGLTGKETDDFDAREYESDEVVEAWEIRK